MAAIGEIAGIIGQINDTQTTIASAVEEQTATTNEMSRNVAEAATGSTEIAQNITGVARSASDTTLPRRQHQPGGRGAGPDGRARCASWSASSATDDGTRRQCPTRETGSGGM